MIKVMNVISDTNFGGAGRVLLNYLKNRDRENFDLCVVVPKGSLLIPHLKETDVKIIEADGLYDRSYSKEDVKLLKKIIAEENPLIVHSHGALSARIAAKQCGKKVVFTRHSVFDVTKKEKSFPRKQINRYINNKYSDVIIAVSPAAADNIIEFGTSPDKITVVFNGVDKVTPSNSEKIIQFKNKFDISDNDFVCSIIARLEKVKGHEYIIKAAKIIKENKITNIKILIAGTGQIEDEIKNMIKEYDVQDIIKFVGFTKDIPTLLSVTDIQLNASYGTEATSMALLEGFSMGIPAIVSDFGGNPYVVKDMENGLIYPKRNEKALYEKIIKLYNDPDLLKSLSKGALDHFNTRFTSKVMAEQTEKIYKNLSGGKN